VIHARQAHDITDVREDRRSKGPTGNCWTRSARRPRSAATACASRPRS